MFLKRPKPLEDDLAAIHSPARAAARRERCKKIREGLDVDALDRIIYSAGRLEENKAMSPLRYDGVLRHPSESQKREAQAAIGRNLDELILRQLEISELAREMQAVHNHPDRMEYARITTAWDHQVNAIAFTHGNRSDVFAGRVRDLLRQREGAAEYGDEAAVRLIEHRLDELTGVPFPQLPEAAWVAADLLPAADRQAEYDRLTDKYGARNADTNGAGKTRTTRKIRPTRPLQALTN